MREGSPLSSEEEFMRQIEAQDPFQFKGRLANEHSGAIIEGAHDKDAEKGDKGVEVKPN